MSIRRLFLDIRNYAARSMNEATLETVFKAEPVTREEVFKEALIYGAGTPMPLSPSAGATSARS